MRPDVSLSETPRLRVPSCLTNRLRLSLQYGEEEVCSDRLDTDFPDIDLSQLDTSDFDSVNCLSELQWCSDQQVDASPASIHCSTADQLFEVRPRPPDSAHWDSKRKFKSGSLPVPEDVRTGNMLMCFRRFKH